MEKYIKEYINDDHKITVQIQYESSCDNYENILSECEFIYVNKETGHQTFKTDINAQLDSLAITIEKRFFTGNVSYKLYKSDQCELEFRRQIDIKQCHWLPYNEVFTERVIFYEDSGYIEYQYTNEDDITNDNFWQPRASFIY